MNFRNKSVAALAGVSALSMALAGCGGASASDSDKPTLSSEPVTITLDWWGSDTRVKLTEAAVQRFMKANPNITVEMINADWGGYWDKLNTSIAGGNAPDVMQMDESYLSTYATQGSLYDLSKVSDYLDLSNMDESNKKAGQIDGVQVAAETSVTLAGVIVNMNILDELGLELPDATKWTWDEFEDFAQQIVDKSGGKYTGVSPTFGGYDFQMWQRQHGVRSMFEGNKVSVDKDLLAEYMQKAYDWTHGTNPIAGSTDRWSENFSAVNGTLADSDMAKGTQAMSIGSGGLTSQLSQYAKAAGHDNFVIVPMPLTEGGESNYYYMKPGMYWSISTTSEHPAEAARLIDFLINDEETGAEFGTDRGIPANNKIREKLNASASENDKKLFAFVDQMSKLTGAENPDPTPNGGSSATNVLLRKMQDVVFGRSSAADAAAQFISELQTELDNVA